LKATSIVRVDDVAPSGYSMDRAKMLPANRQSPSSVAAARASKIENTVRYLGIEADDSIEIAEKIGI
jgi:hypothetical protein